MRRLAAALVIGSVVVGGGCGGSEDASIDARPRIDADPNAPDAGPSDARPIDAIPTPDATPSSVQVVDCNGATLASTVTTLTFAFTFSPSGATTNTVTIGTNEIVKFVMSNGHSTVSNPSGVFAVGFNTTKCLKFTATGSFPFRCNPHNFLGSVVVQ